MEWWGYILSTLLIAFIMFFVYFFSSYFVKLFYERRINSKKRLKWILKTKLESTFLFTEFTEEELQKGLINGDEINLINSFCNHFKYFQEKIIDVGYLNQKIAKKWKDEFLNKILRPFLVKYEKYNNDKYKNKMMNLTDDQKKEFFIDLKNVKDEIQEFYKNIESKKDFKK